MRLFLLMAKNHPLGGVPADSGAARWSCPSSACSARWSGPEKSSTNWQDQLRISARSAVMSFRRTASEQNRHFFSASAVGLVGSLTKDEILFQAGDFVIGFELGLSVHQTVCREASPASGLGVRSRCVDFCPIMGGSRAEGVRGRIFANSERKFSFDPAIRIIHCRLDG